MRATIKKTRIALALLFLPKEFRILANAVMQLGSTLKQIADSTKVLEIARAIEETKRRREAAERVEVDRDSIH